MKFQVRWNVLFISNVDKVTHQCSDEIWSRNKYKITISWLDQNRNCISYLEYIYSSHKWGDGHYNETKCTKSDKRRHGFDVEHYVNWFC